jgi:two-component system, NarL family, nitrate/nitrite response regulator NarL
VNILIVDDHALFRQGLVLLLSELESESTFFEASACPEGLAILDQQRIDLVLLDLHLANEISLSFLSPFQAQCDAPIVMLSSDDSPAVVRECIDQGASGFIPKSSNAPVLIAALKLILAGGTYLPPNVLHVGSKRDYEYANAARSELSVSTADASVLGHLSDRQLQVLMCAIQGKANKVIARELALSEGTIKAHMSASYRVLGVNNRTEAVFMAAKLGLSAS